MKTSRWTEDLASITAALWAKRGERGILPEAGDEGEENNFFSSPHLAIRANCLALRVKCHVRLASLIKRLLCRLQRTSSFLIENDWLNFSINWLRTWWENSEDKFKTHYLVKRKSSSDRYLIHAQIIIAVECKLDNLSSCEEKSGIFFFFPRFNHEIHILNISVDTYEFFFTLKFLNFKVVQSNEWNRDTQHGS